MVNVFNEKNTFNVHAMIYILFTALLFVVPYRPVNGISSGNDELEEYIFDFIHPYFLPLVYSDVNFDYYTDYYTDEIPKDADFYQDLDDENYDRYPMSIDYEEEDNILGLDEKTDDDLLAILTFQGDSEQGWKSNEEENEFPVLRRRKRTPSRYRSRSSSSKSSSSSSSSRKSSSSSSDSGGGWFSRKTTSKPRYTTKAPAATTVKPSAPDLETINKHDISKSSGGLYPTGHYPPAGPSHTPGYPSPGYPSSGYPSPGYPSAGYPAPHQPIQPSPGYPYPPSPGTPLRPSPGYPHPPYMPGQPIHPSPGYPHSPSSGNPIQPSSGYPYLPPGQPHLPNIGHHQAPGSVHGGGISGGIYPGAKPGLYPGYTGYPSPGAFQPTKISKQDKIKEKIKQAVLGYAAYRMHKNMNKNFKNKVKFISPSHGMGMGMYGNQGFYPQSGGMSGNKNKGLRLVKKIIGAAIKIQIAKYALKYGYKAAKLYFEPKIGRPLSDKMIDKFASRYRRQRTRRMSKKGFKLENVTFGEDCNRECLTGRNLTCLFNFHVHLYQTLSRACYNCPNTKLDCRRAECIVGSGRRKLVSAVNRQIPGPAIQVCEGDEILVEVHNDLPNSEVTLHFRGQSYFGRPNMDGTPGLTQKPISSGDVFIYSFTATQPGTHFWHANSGVSRSDGVYGPFVVKEAIDAYGALYDVDLSNQTLLISEDFVKRGEEQLEALGQKRGKIEVFSLLINGIGFRLDDSVDMRSSNITYARLNVLPGKSHRLRIISAVSSNCPFVIRVLGRNLMVIYVDGSPVTPKDSNNLLVSPGERFDVILGALPDGLHWIEVKGLLDCENKVQYAVLEAKTVFSSENKNETKEELLPTSNPRLDSQYSELNNEIVFCNSSDVSCSRNMSSTLSLPANAQTPNITLYLSLTARKIHNEHIYSLLYYDIASIPPEEQTPTYQINNLTLKLPPIPLLVNDKPLNGFECSSAGVRRQQCVEIFCECLHLLEVPMGAVIDLVLINEGAANSMEPQTMYLHGHNFWVLSKSKEFIYSNESLDNSTSPYMDRMKVIIKDAEELLPRNLQFPIRMNSITVPESGYAVIRFFANNPGYWLLESSSVFKSARGMGVVLRVDKNPPLQNLTNI